MAYWHINNWTKLIYPSLLWNYPESEQKLYLTFDDGPTPGITEKVLDLLNEYNAKATFFCLGRNAERHPDIYQSIIEKGHSLGNHSYSHLKGWRTNNQEYYQDIELAGDIVQSNLFRPPYGQITRSQIAHLKQKYNLVMWNVMSHDYEPRISKEYCLKAVLKYTNNGTIIVFHDSVKASEKLLYVLPRILKVFSSKGFTFEKIIAHNPGSFIQQ